MITVKAQARSRLHREAIRYRSQFFCTQSHIINLGAASPVSAILRLARLCRAIDKKHAAADEILNTLMDARADRAAHDAVRKQARRLQPPIAQDAALEIRNRVGVVFSESLCRSGRVAEFAGLSNT